jgi:hypothetical protein
MRLLPENMCLCTVARAYLPAGRATSRAYLPAGRATWTVWIQCIPGIIIEHYCVYFYGYCDFLFPTIILFITTTTFLTYYIIDKHYSPILCNILPMTSQGLLIDKMEG